MAIFDKFQDYISGGQGARLHWWGTAGTVTLVGDRGQGYTGGGQGGKVTLEGDRGQGYIGGGQGANPPEADESLTHARQKITLRMRIT